jgi:hypothetical protein
MAASKPDPAGVDNHSAERNDCLILEPTFENTTEFDINKSLPACEEKLLMIKQRYGNLSLKGKARPRHVR